MELPPFPICPLFKLLFIDYYFYSMIFIWRIAFTYSISYQKYLPAGRDIERSYYKYQAAPTPG
jgi:hypothetical protein